MTEDPHEGRGVEVHTSESGENGSTPDGCVRRGNALLRFDREFATIGGRMNTTIPANGQMDRRGMGCASTFRNHRCWRKRWLGGPGENQLASGGKNSTYRRGCITSLNLLCARSLRKRTRVLSSRFEGPNPVDSWEPQVASSLSRHRTRDLR